MFQALRNFLLLMNAEIIEKAKGEVEAGRSSTNPKQENDGCV